jgi:dihydrofolate reductase
MQKVRVEGFSISIDGFGAGPDQNIENPLGKGGTELHQWLLPTQTFQSMTGKDEGTIGIDNDFASRGFSNIGAWIMGRNMFGPIRGPWLDDDWKGWWGKTPPYHVPVFVLTNYPRRSIEMDGGTTFHFVTEGINAALDRAFDAANGKDVRLGGGVSTIRQFLEAQLIDEIHMAISPILLGSGESLFSGINMLSLGYKCTAHLPTENATHILIEKDT